jgi:large subunit ribosomal protein L29
MKAQVIKEMSIAEIQERIDNEKSMLQKLQMNHAVSPLDNPLKLKYTRKTIARLLTELNFRESNLSAEVLNSESAK